ncbi:MAG: hypothetical protein ACE3JK_11505 [Sporolactobacillus sp.]
MGNTIRSIIDRLTGKQEAGVQYGMPVFLLLINVAKKGGEF